MKYAQWWLPFIFILFLTPLTPYLDLAISQYFYDPETQQFTNNAFYNFLYDYGPIPSIATVVCAIFIYLISFIFPKWKKWRASSLIMILTMVLGVLVITHGLLKDHWGRPRPKQITEFGGNQSFRPYYSPNFFHQPEPSKSFACGHCSTGFYFFALAIVGRRLKSKLLMTTGFLLAFTLGILLSLMRIAQGGHFLSDTLFSALIMWYTALICDWLILPEKTK